MHRHHSYHALVHYDPQGEVIDGHSVVLSAHHFWRHVPGRSACLVRVRRLPNASYAKVSNAEVAHTIEHQVFWLDVPVNDPLGVDVLEAHEDADDDVFSIS